MYLFKNNQILYNFDYLYYNYSTKSGNSERFLFMLASFIPIPVSLRSTSLLGFLPLPLPLLFLFSILWMAVTNASWPPIVGVWLSSRVKNDNHEGCEVSRWNSPIMQCDPPMVLARSLDMDSHANRQHRGAGGASYASTGPPVKHIVIIIMRH